MYSFNESCFFLTSMKHWNHPLLSTQYLQRSILLRCSKGILCQLKHLFTSSDATITPNTAVFVLFELKWLSWLHTFLWQNSHHVKGVPSGSKWFQSLELVMTKSCAGFLLSTDKWEKHFSVISSLFDMHHWYNFFLVSNHKLILARAALLTLNSSNLAHKLSTE